MNDFKNDKEGRQVAQSNDQPDDIKVQEGEIYCIQKGGHSGAEKIPKDRTKCKSSAHKTPRQFDYYLQQNARAVERDARRGSGEKGESQGSDEQAVYRSTKEIHEQIIFDMTNAPA